WYTMPRTRQKTFVVARRNYDADVKGRFIGTESNGTSATLEAGRLQSWKYRRAIRSGNGSGRPGFPTERRTPPRRHGRPSHFGTVESRRRPAPAFGGCGSDGRRS